MYKRRLVLSLASEESCFLWGARQTGKSTLPSTSMSFHLLRDYGGLDGGRRN